MEDQNARKLLLQGSKKFRIVRRKSKLGKAKDTKKGFQIPVNKLRLLKINKPVIRMSLAKKASFIVKNSKKKESKKLAFRIQKALEKKNKARANPKPEILIN